MLCLLILLMHIYTTNASFNEGKYRPRSEYEENLNNFTRDTYSSGFTNGYRLTGYGGDSNYVIALFQCRGDSYESYCRPCFATAIAGLKRRCPRNKGAIIWYDQCFLYVTSVIPIKSFDLAKIDYENTFSMHNPNNMNGDINLFNKKIGDLLNKLILIANKNGTYSETYAVGEEGLGTKKVYAMVQCSYIKVSCEKCEKCLKWSINELSKCCNGKQGASVFGGTTCNFRYALYPFIRT